MILPSLPSGRLVQEVVLARCWLQHRRPRRNCKSNQIRVRVITGCGRSCTDGRLAAEPDMQVAVKHACEPCESIKTPDSNQRPEVGVVFSFKYSSMVEQGNNCKNREHNMEKQKDLIASTSKDDGREDQQEAHCNCALLVVSQRVERRGHMVPTIAPIYQ